MTPSPISVVRTLPQYLWRRLPTCAPRRALSGKATANNRLSSPPIRRYSQATVRQDGTGSLPISTSMQADLPRSSFFKKADKPVKPSNESVEAATPKNKADQQESKRDSILSSVASDTEVPDGEAVIHGTLTPQTTNVDRVKSPHQAKVATLRNSLHRVLFSPGVHFIRDPRTDVQNFEPVLEEIPAPKDFAFHRCPTYITPSQDPSLAALAEKRGCEFIGSTSSLTQALASIYFALSGGKGINLSTISMDFQNERKDFTFGATLPASLILRNLPDHPTVYAVDSDKSNDVDNVLSDYGRVLEKVLTSEQADFNRFLRKSPESAVSKKERAEREAYAYCKTGSMLMRSQLDCVDSRLPGSGVFDVKTRACHPIRHDRANHQANSVYDIATDRGMGATFERELYDLTRSGMLKYSMQVRIGGMDGVFCAYHNTKRLLGFQYLPLSEMDEKLFGSPEIGELTFKYCAALLEVILKYVTSQVSGQDIALIIRHSHDRSNSVDIAFYPLSDPEKSQGARMSIQNVINGERVMGELSFGEDVKPGRQWKARYRVHTLEATTVEKIIATTKKTLGSMSTLSVPEGKTVEEMTAQTAHEATSAPKLSSGLPKTALLQWKKPSGYIKGLRENAKENGRAYEARKELWWTPAMEQGGQNGHSVSRRHKRGGKPAA